MEEKIIKDLTGNREEKIAPKNIPEKKTAEVPSGFKRPPVRLAQPAEQMQEHLSGKRAEQTENTDAPEKKENRENEKTSRPYNDRNRDRYGKDRRNNKDGRRDDRKGGRRGDRWENRQPAPETKETSAAPEEGISETAVTVTVGNDLQAEVAANRDAERVEENLIPEAVLSTEPVPQIVVVGIRFRGTGKTYYFDPAGIAFKDGDHAIVETVRGVEYGDVVMGNKPVPAKDVVQPLKPVARKATDYDTRHNNDNRIAEQNAKPIFYDRVAANKLEMQLVDVEYTFDNSKLCFYFTAEGRVDFRELVKELAGIFRTRIELRQIGVRDEAKLFGGLGICGRPFCCKQFLPDFTQVSIKMAKEQNLSLASAKISGSCGRLMCCLRFEQDTYERENAEMPAKDTVFDTPKGLGAVLESNFLTRKIKLRMLDDNSVKSFTLEELEAFKNGVTLPKNDEFDYPAEDVSGAPGKEEKQPEGNLREHRRDRGRRGNGKGENFKKDDRRDENREQKANANASAEQPPENKDKKANADGERRDRHHHGHRGGRRHGGQGGNRNGGQQNGGQQSGQ